MPSDLLAGPSDSIVPLSQPHAGVSSGACEPITCASSATQADVLQQDASSSISGDAYVYEVDRTALVAPVSGAPFSEVRSTACVEPGSNAQCSDLPSFLFPGVQDVPACSRILHILREANWPKDGPCRLVCSHSSNDFSGYWNFGVRASDRSALTIELSAVCDDVCSSFEADRVEG